MPQYLWADGEPNNSEGKDAVIILSLKTNAFQDMNYDTNPKFVVCEVRNCVGQLLIYVNSEILLQILVVSSYN
jgi:hypothetical protein